MLHLISAQGPTLLLMRRSGEIKETATSRQHEVAALLCGMGGHLLIIKIVHYLTRVNFLVAELSPAVSLAK